MAAQNKLFRTHQIPKVKVNNLFLFNLQKEQA